MADDSIEYSKLPLDIRAKLAELDLELSEGKIFFTRKSRRLFFL